MIFQREISSIYKKFQHLKKKYNKKRPRDKWEIINIIIKQIVSLFGCQIMDRHFKLNCKTAFPGILVIYYIALMICMVYLLLG